MSRHLLAAARAAQSFVMFSLAPGQQTALTDTVWNLAGGFISRGKRRLCIAPTLPSCLAASHEHCKRREDARFESTLQPWRTVTLFCTTARAPPKNSPPFSALLTCQVLHQYNPAVAADGATTAETARKVSVLHASVQYESRNDTYLSHCFLGRHFPRPHRDTLERTRMIMNAPSCA